MSKAYEAHGVVQINVIARVKQGAADSASDALVQLLGQVKLRLREDGSVCVISEDSKDSEDLSVSLLIGQEDVHWEEVFPLDDEETADS